jgi:hypothetical protein
MSETCPKCGAAQRGWRGSSRAFKCDTVDPGLGLCLEQSVACLKRQLAALQQQLDDERRAKVELLAAAQRALDHVTELRDAWMRGAIREHDGKGGTRSNRNVDVEVELRRTLAALKGASHDRA